MNEKQTYAEAKQKRLERKTTLKQKHIEDVQKGRDINGKSQHVDCSFYIDRLEYLYRCIWKGDINDMNKIDAMIEITKIQGEFSGHIENKTINNNYNSPNIYLKKEDENTDDSEESDDEW